MVSIATRKLTREYKSLVDECGDNNNKIGLLNVELIDNNIKTWKITFRGPEETPYETGVFSIQLSFQDKYPFSPPSIKFLTSIWHPNIDTKGSVCVDFLGSSWKPILGVKSVLIMLRSLLNDPNPNSPLNSSAANTYVKNKEQYAKDVIEYIEKHATPKTSKISKKH